MQMKRWSYSAASGRIIRVVGETVAMYAAGHAVSVKPSLG